eukprot:4164334-Pleurochrysis_carterae.AAC.1
MEAWAPGHRPPAKLVELLETHSRVHQAARAARPKPLFTNPPNSQGKRARLDTALALSGASSSSGA